MGGLMDRFNVKQKIMVSVSVLFIVVMLVLGIVLDRIITNSQMANFEEEADLQSTQVDNAMHLFLNGLRDGLVNMANDPILRAGGEITRYTDPDVIAKAASDGNIAMDPQAKGGLLAQVDGFAVAQKRQEGGQFALKAQAAHQAA